MVIRMVFGKTIMIMVSYGEKETISMVKEKVFGKTITKMVS
jgi:hypothetical protein